MKLSPIDVKSLGMWDEYTNAQNAMFMATDTKACPWTVIRSDDKKRARLNCIRYVLNALSYPHKDESLVSDFDSAIIGPKEVIYDTSEW